MLNSLVKIAAPLLLVIALLFLTGTVSTAVSLAGYSRADLCCEKDAEKKQLPEAGGECTDPGCGCLSCSASLLFLAIQVCSNPAEFRPSLWASAQAIPSPPDRSIDYPPEVL